MIMVIVIVIITVIVILVIMIIVIAIVIVIVIVVIVIIVIVVIIIIVIMIIVIVIVTTIIPIMVNFSMLLLGITGILSAHERSWLQQEHLSPIPRVFAAFTGFFDFCVSWAFPACNTSVPLTWCCPTPQLWSPCKITQLEL